MVRNIHSRVRQLQYQWHLTLAKLMDFWIVMIKAKKMRSKNRHERNTEKKLKLGKRRGVNGNHSHENL